MAMTKKEMFAEIIKMAQGAETQVLSEDIVAFAEHEIDLLNKKTSGSRKPTKTQTENEGFKATILEVLTSNGYPMTIDDIQSKNEELAALTGQRISALLSQLRKSEQIVRTYDKKKAYFTAAIEEGEGGNA